MKETISLIYLIEKSQKGGKRGLNDQLSRFRREKAAEAPAQGRKTSGKLPDTETGIPLEVALSLLKPDELVKLQRYVRYYIAKYGGSEEHSPAKPPDMEGRRPS